MILTVIKEHVNPHKNKKVTFRSYKHFDRQNFLNDLETTPLNQSQVNDVNTMYNTYESKFKEILDKHAPAKEKFIKKDPPPYMNSEYRKIIYKTREAHNKYIKHRSEENWNRYKKV